MFNHTLALLLNEDPLRATSRQYAWDPPLPSEFRAIELTGPLREAHNLLFGESVSPDMKRRLAWNYLRIMEVAQLEPQLDSRVTYDLKQVPFADEALYVPVITPVGDSETSYFVLNPRERAYSDRYLSLRWEVQVLDNDQLQIKTYHRPGTITLTTNTTGDRLEAVTLPDSYFQIAPPATVGSRWRIAVGTEPLLSLPAVLQRLRNASTEVLAEVFQPTTPLRNVRPYPQAREIWQEDKFGLRAVAAFLLAYIDRLEATRLKQRV